MNHHDQQDVQLEQIWQSINHDGAPSAEQLSRIAQKDQLKNTLCFIGDIVGNLVLLVLLYIAWQRDMSALVMIWLVLAFAYGSFLSWQFYKIRGQSQLALLDSITTYRDYLSKRAHIDIKVGRLFNLSTLVITTTMAVVFVIEQWLLGDPIISSAKQWLYLIGWVIFWVSLMAYYGYWKVRKGQQALINLANDKDSV